MRGPKVSMTVDDLVTAMVGRSIETLFPNRLRRGATCRSRGGSIRAMPYSVDGKEPATAVLDPELYDCRDLAGGSGRSMGRIWLWRVGSDHELPHQTGQRVPRRSGHNPRDNEHVGETLGWPCRLLPGRQAPR